MLIGAERVKMGLSKNLFIIFLLVLFSLIQAQVILPPTPQPSSLPSVSPTKKPSALPTAAPTAPSPVPTAQPTTKPSPQPSYKPSALPTTPSARPSSAPSPYPTAPSPQPSARPTSLPTASPSPMPSALPTNKPTPSPTQPTARPSPLPSLKPTPYPTEAIKVPSARPTNPTAHPTFRPTNPTGQPSGQPSRQPTRQPTRQPSRQPSSQPTGQPTRQPTTDPTVKYTRSPTPYGSSFPTGHPTGRPSALPNITHEEGGKFNATCPRHGFLSGVRVECVAIRDTITFHASYMKVRAASTVDYALSYQVDEPGYNANDDEPLPQGAVPALYVTVPSFIPDDTSDPSTFIIAQSSSADGYTDKLVGIALDGVPIYTALGPLGVDLLSLEGHGGDPDSDRYAVDSCGGSYGPTPDGVRYHYRTIPACVLEPIGLTHRGYQDRRRQYVHSTHELLDGFEGTLAMTGPRIIGWALTGHPIYSPFTARGLLQDGLDNCNGKFASSTAVRDLNNGTQTYGYYATPTFPYLIGCFGPGIYSLDEHQATREGGTQSLQQRVFDACPSGYIPTPDFSSTGCSPCPAGRYATVAYNRPGAETGQEFNLLTGCAHVCPIGSYCPPASTKPSKCPAGRFGETTGLPSSDCTGPCEAGYRCPPGSITGRSYVCGDTSVYCPAGSSDGLAVDEGFYSTPEMDRHRTPFGARGFTTSKNAIDSFATRRTAQAQCGPGTFCQSGARFPCPAGTYGSSLGLISPACSGLCPLGHFCPVGSTHPTPCPAGRYGDSTGLRDSDCNGLCSPGHWCGAGSISSTQNLCKAGRYGAETGLKTQHCSPLCEPDTILINAASEDFKFCEARSCQAGYYCPLASTSSTQMPCGDDSVYCPPHSATPTPVTRGWYTVGPLSTPEAQNSNDSTTRTKQLICELGHYCIAGVKYRCPLGHYGGIEGLSAESCSGLCWPGYTCGMASTMATEVNCYTGPEFYCPRGSYEKIAVPDGYYSVNGSLTTRSAVLPCAPGSYCSDGIQRLCPTGRYSVGGSKTVQCDGECDAGYWCSTGSTSRTQSACPAGRYGTTGMKTESCKGQCIAGYYCPTASTSPYQHECGGEKVYCPAGSSAPLAIKPGYYSSGGNSTIRERQDFCEVSLFYSTPPNGKRRSRICPSTTV